MYGIDLGLMRQLSFQHSENQGRLLENLVFLELKRQSKTVYYHHHKGECDFVIKEKKQHHRSHTSLLVPLRCQNKTARNQWIARGYVSLPTQRGTHSDRG